MEAIKEEKSDVLCTPVVGYSDTEKLTYGLDGASIAQNHLKMPVTNTQKLSWEYLIKNNKPIVVWNLRTYETFIETYNLFKNCGIDFNPTSDFAALIHNKFNNVSSIKR